MSITIAGSLNFSAHEDKIFRGTVDFVWSALNKFDNQFNRGFSFALKGISSITRGGIVPPQWQR